MAIPGRVEEPRLSQLFPDVTPDNASPHTFEIGLVLGGTVSAGAYTAGALDFLLEALEAWHSDPRPLHRIVIKTAGGSSGGAVCTAILGLLSGRKVPHIQGTLQALAANLADTGNPLWDLWVNTFQIDPLLSTGDIDANQNVDGVAGAAAGPVQHVPSLLNSDMITRAGAKLAAIGSTASEPLPYFAAPFRIAITLANLRGVPYKISHIPALGRFTGAAYVAHDDFAWFAFPNGADRAAPLPVGKREDEFWLEAAAGAASGVVDYQTLADFATASGALPVGLSARTLSRPPEHYHYRPKVRPVKDRPEGYRVDWPDPDWSELPDAVLGTYAFTAVDGGTLNNDPVSLVHRNLSGLVGINPRGRSDAKRAILLIDPLADQPTPIAQVGKGLVAVAESIIPAVVGAARYLTADMELFADDDVFSRFQLVPFRPELGKIGEAALAGTSLFAAAGWCAREFRVHDFLLGRANMQAYLRQELVLAGDNPLFDQWQSGDRADFAMDASSNRIAVDGTTPKASYFLPVIPDKTGPKLPVPTWPNGAFNPDNLAAPLKARLDAVFRKLVKDNGGGGLLLPWAVGLFIVPGVVDFVVSAIAGNFKSELTTAGLWPPKPQ
jgi:hypothetical protein